MAQRVNTGIAAAALMGALSSAAAGDEPGKYLQVPLAYGHLAAANCSSRNVDAVKLLVGQALTARSSDAKPTDELAKNFCAAFGTMFPLTAAMAADVLAQSQAAGYQAPVIKLGVYQGGPALLVRGDTLRYFEIQD